MRKSSQEIRENKTTRFLATLTGDSEFFGVVGAGYPTSFYRVLVRATPTGKWWRFEDGAGQAVEQNPIRSQAALKVGRRAVTVWGPISRLADYKVWGERAALVQLFARAKELHEKA